MHTPNWSLAHPKTKVNVGCWNVRTMFFVGKTAQITTEIRCYGIEMWELVNADGQDLARIWTNEGTNR